MLRNIKNITKKIVKEEVLRFINEKIYKQPEDMPDHRLNLVAYYVLRALAKEMQDHNVTSSMWLREELLGALVRAYEIGYENGSDKEASSRSKRDPDETHLFP